MLKSISEKFETICIYSFIILIFTSIAYLLINVELLYYIAISFIVVGCVITLMNRIRTEYLKRKLKKLKEEVEDEHTTVVGETIYSITVSSEQDGLILNVVRGKDNKYSVIQHNDYDITIQTELKETDD